MDSRSCNGYSVLNFSLRADLNLMLEVLRSMYSFCLALRIFHINYQFESFDIQEYISYSEAYYITLFEHDTFILRLF